MATINIDNVEYDTDALSDDAKAQFVSIQAVDRRLADLDEQMAILKTARVAYANELRKMLPAIN